MRVPTIYVKDETCYPSIEALAQRPEYLFVSKFRQVSDGLDQAIRDLVRVLGDCSLQISEIHQYQYDKYGVGLKSFDLHGCFLVPLMDCDANHVIQLVYKSKDKPPFAAIVVVDQSSRACWLSPTHWVKLEWKHNCDH